MKCYRIKTKETDLIFKYNIKSTKGKVLLYKIKVKSKASGLIRTISSIVGTSNITQIYKQPFNCFYLVAYTADEVEYKWKEIF